MQRRIPASPCHPVASGYFENVWAWTADHDIDEPPTGNDTQPHRLISMSPVACFIESTGPVWLYGTASEHNAFYQYQFSERGIFTAGHMQTETPYYMPNPDALGVFTPGAFTNDPTFDNCDPNPVCTEAWALRVLHSQDVYIYGAGFYNFFNVSFCPYFCARWMHIWLSPRITTKPASVMNLARNGLSRPLSRRVYGSMTSIPRARHSWLVLKGKGVSQSASSWSWLYLMLVVQWRRS